MDGEGVSLSALREIRVLQELAHASSQAQQPGAISSNTAQVPGLEQDQADPDTERRMSNSSAGTSCMSSDPGDGLDASDGNQHIIQLLDAFPHKSKFVLVLEHLASDLFTIIKDPHQELGPADVKAYLQQLLRGLAHIHARGIVHRCGEMGSSHTWPAQLVRITCDASQLLSRAGATQSLRPLLCCMCFLLPQGHQARQPTCLRRRHPQARRL